jgi:hypothetical protein
MIHVADGSRPFRVGVFASLADADRAVAGLLDAGFTKDQITVLCSDKAREAHFRSFEHEQPAGSHTAAAAATGGAIGAALGGLTAIAGAAATGGVALLAAGGLAAWTGGVVGGLVGAMMTRGVERELADYYDQAVLKGRILVAAEAAGDEEKGSLAEAERVLREAGAEPVSLPEG